MPAGVFGENLFFDRDTKVFLSQSQGRPISILSESSNILTSTSPHGLTTGARIMVFTTSLTLIYTGVIYYVRRFSDTTFKIFLTKANALSNISPVPIGGSVSSTNRFVAVDEYVPLTKVYIRDSQTIEFDAPGHSLIVGDVVCISGIMDLGYLYLEGTYTIASTATDYFTIVPDPTVASIINETLENPGSIKLALVKTWYIPAVDYSTTQNNLTTVVGLSEMSSIEGVSRRGSTTFTIAKSAVDWTITTLISGNEDPLWANLVANNKYTGTNWGLGYTKGATTQFTFAHSEVASLGTVDIYFVLGASKNTAPYSNFAEIKDELVIYKMSGASVNSANIPLDVKTYASITWGGQAQELVKCGSLAVSEPTVRPITIMNKKTSFSISSGATDYAITLMSAELNIDNGIKYALPDELTRVNKPLEHITGTRRVSGFFRAYLDEASLGSMDLVSALMLTGNRNSFSINFHIGGKGASPGMLITLGNVHLEMPTIEMDEAILVDVKFHGLSSSGANEIGLIEYK